MSLDGYVAGPRQSVENPLGVGGMRLQEWTFPLAVRRSMHGLPGGAMSESNAVVEDFANIGATVMGRNIFGGHPGAWNREEPWSRWWGSDPPFHHPVFVDEMESNPVPTLLGSGERLFEDVGDDLHGLEVVRTVATPEVTHLKFARRVA
jgi:hypothetical protein